MAVRLDKTYTFDKENLIVDTEPPLITAAYTLVGGQGVLKRGSVIGLDKTNFKGTLIATGHSAQSVFILADDVDTGSDAAKSFGCVGYRSGHFNANGLITKDSYALTTKDLEEMRCYNLYVSDAVSGEEE